MSYVTKIQNLIEYYSEVTHQYIQTGADYASKAIQSSALYAKAAYTKTLYYMGNIANGIQYYANYTWGLAIKTAQSIHHFIKNLPEYGLQLIQTALKFFKQGMQAGYTFMIKTLSFSWNFFKLLANGIYNLLSEALSLLKECGLALIRFARQLPGIMISFLQSTSQLLKDFIKHGVTLITETLNFSWNLLKSIADGVCQLPELVMNALHNTWQFLTKNCITLMREAGRLTSKIFNASLEGLKLIANKLVEKTSYMAGWLYGAALGILETASNCLCIVVGITYGICSALVNLLLNPVKWVIGPELAKSQFITFFGRTISGLGTAFIIYQGSKLAAAGIKKLYNAAYSIYKKDESVAQESMDQDNVTQESMEQDNVAQGSESYIQKITKQTLNMFFLFKTQKAENNIETSNISEAVNMNINLNSKPSARL